MKARIQPKVEIQTKLLNENRNLSHMFTTHKKFDLSPKLKLGVGRGYSKNLIFKFGAFFCLIVALGLTANAIRILYAHKTDNPLGTPQVLGASDVKPDPSTVEFVQYKVQKGDTLFNISQKFNIDWTTLATINNIQSPFTLKLGQTLNIPK